MKRWLNTALALVLMLAIAAGGFFLPNFVSARLDRRNQDAEFSLSTGDEQSPATVLRLKLTDGIQNLFYGTEEPVELDESAAVHTLAEMAQYAQDLLGALEKDSALFGGGFSVQEGATVQYANYGSGFVLWGITLSNPRGDTASFLLDDATGCVLALSYEFAYDFGFQIRQNDLWDYLLCVFENRVGATVAAALGEPYDEVQIPMPDAAQKMLGLRVRGTNTVPMRLLNAGEEGNYNDGMDSSITDYLQFYDPDADTAFSLPAWRVENTLYFNAVFQRAMMPFGCQSVAGRITVSAKIGPYPLRGDFFRQEMPIMQTNDLPRIGVLSADPAAVTQFLRRVQALGADPTALLPLSPAAVPDCEPYLCGTSTQSPLPKLRAAAEVLAASGCTVIAVPDSAGVFCEEITAAVGIPTLGVSGPALQQLVGKLRQRASVLCTPGVRAANGYGIAARRYGLYCSYPDAPVQALLGCVQPEKACSEQVLRSIIELELARGNDSVVLDSAQLCAAFAHFGLAAHYPQAADGMELLAQAALLHTAAAADARRA